MTTIQEDLFASFMTDGHRLFGAGDLKRALFAYEQAFNHAKGHQQVAEAIVMHSLVKIRDRGKIKAVLKALVSALQTARLANDHVLMHRIERDIVGAVIEAHLRSPLGHSLLLDNVKHYLDSSIKGFSHEDLDNHREWIVSMSYLGRFRRVTGNRGAARSNLGWAFREMMKFDDKDSQILALNIGIWLMLSCNRRDRARFEPEIRKLIEQTGHTRRNDQLWIIMRGGMPLYRFVEILPIAVQRLGKKLVGV